ncbi:hypothetical protein C8Q75DRAFT_774034 [Abortiporus biennis]|nr:hypothetical protein C8Q75DRAFT_774034 [Abortiporus biennis]
MHRRPKMLTELPTDIIDRILTFLPDYRSLASALRSSKATFYATFQVHPKSIIKAIANNIAGPTLPQALRRLEAQKLIEEQNGADHDYDLLTTLPDEAQILEQVSIDRSIGHFLAVNAQTVRSLEDLFSIRYKDRTSTRSKLDDEESFRFHRAMYRFWIVIFLEQLLDNDGEETQEIHNFLNQYPSPQLRQIEQVATFLRDVVSWNACSGNDTFDDVCYEWDVFNGPDHVLRSYQHGEQMDFHIDPPPIDFEMFDRQYHRAMDDIRRKRSLQYKDREEAILNSVTGKDDQCHRCHLVAGVHLWGLTNFHLFGNFHSPKALVGCLNGYLPQNPVERDFVIQHILKRDDEDNRTFNYADMVQEIFDLEQDSDGVWDKNNWYCDTCMMVLCKTRFTRWWISRKATLDLPVKEDCWYGYNCRTQRHRFAHAQRLNHLCEPTRGDPLPVIGQPNP